MIAPWLDAGLSNPAIDDVEGTDPSLSRPGLNVCATSWAGAVSLNDPRVSPLFGDMTTVPPIDLYVGDRDITVADCRLLRDRLSHDHIRYHEERGAVHVYPLLPHPREPRGPTRHDCPHQDRIGSSRPLTLRGCAGGFVASDDVTHHPGSLPRRPRIPS